MPIERRRALQALEALYESHLDGHYGELAHHYRHGGNSPQAVVYLQRAGQRAMQQSAFGEAITHFTTALELLQTLSDMPQRARQELDIQLELGPAFMATKGPGDLDVEQAYRRARELCEQLGATPQLFSALVGLWRHYQLGAEQETARTLGERLLQLAHRQDAPELLMVAHRALAQTLFFLGDLAAARVHLEQGLTFYRPQHCSLATRYGTNPSIPCLYCAAQTLWLLGCPHQAREHIHTMVTLARDGADLFSVASALLYAARLHLLRREVEAAREHVEALRALAAEQEFRSLMVYGTILHGSVCIALGQHDEGVALMRQGLAAHREVGTEAIRPMLLALLAAAYERGGTAEEGLCVVDEALALVDKYGVRYYEAELYRLKGVLLLRLPIPIVHHAEGCLVQAVDIARRQQAKSWELRATISLAQLLQRQGKTVEAHTRLAEVVDWFTAGFDTGDLQEARTLLEAYSPSPS